MAAAEGTTEVVATPHVLREPWRNADPGPREELVRFLNDRLGGRPPMILTGCEYFFSADALELLELGPASPLTRIAGTPYLLVEFDAVALPPTAPAVFHEFRVQGIIPVVAHPERHAILARDPGRLRNLVDRGAVAQITAGSLLGDFGPLAKSACDELFRRGLVHLVASDAHSVAHRPPRLSAARAFVRKTWGVEAEAGLFEANPAALLAGKPLPYAPA
jgi:protein-tyrosine phosphatase